MVVSIVHTKETKSCFIAAIYSITRMALETNWLGFSNFLCTTIYIIGDIFSVLFSLLIGYQSVCIFPPFQYFSKFDNGALIYGLIHVPIRMNPGVSSPVGKMGRKLLHWFRQIFWANNMTSFLQIILKRCIFSSHFINIHVLYASLYGYGSHLVPFMKFIS